MKSQPFWLIVLFNLIDFFENFATCSQPRTFIKQFTTKLALSTIQLFICAILLLLLTQEQFSIRWLILVFREKWLRIRKAIVRKNRNWKVSKILLMKRAIYFAWNHISFENYHRNTLWIEWMRLCASVWDRFLENSHQKLLIGFGVQSTVFRIGFLFLSSVQIFSHLMEF